MSTTQQTRIRAVSARLANSTPTVPSLSKARKYHQKTQLMENNQTPSQPMGSNYTSYHKGKGLLGMRSNFQQTDPDEFNKMLPKPEKIPKEPQQLFEQNLHLKKKLHRMKQQLVRNRTKIQNLNTKNQKYTKQFNREFEKKIYWNGNHAYLISGIKAQYEKLKEEFETKCQENETLKRELIESSAPEYKIYAENLQEENKKIVDKFNKMTAIVSNNSSYSSSKDKSPNDELIAELDNKKTNLENKLQSVENELTNEQQKSLQLQKKIEFLQKLLIEKDNAQYHAMRKSKKLQRQKNIIEDRLKQNQSQNQDALRNYQVKIEKMKVMEEKRYKVEKDIFDRALAEKEVKIQKLQKEIAYLSTLLTYWKPLDELKDYNVEHESSFNPDHNQKEEYSSSNNHKKHPQLQLQQQPGDSCIINRSIRPSKQVDTPQRDVSVEFTMKQSKQISHQIKSEQPRRVPQSADERYNPSAEKRRKVDYKQIEHIGENLRYRMLGLRLNINEARKYFDYPKQPSNPEASEPSQLSAEEEKPWEEEYITMHEVKEVLKEYPFQLTEEESHLLARYMIQDSVKDYVYVDPNNQHKRSVVKSILKALVGDYQILDTKKQLQVEKECHDMLEKYQANLISALSMMASSGFISRRKFMELLSSLGIELSEEGKDYLVCKMLLKSESLHLLSYMTILE